MSSTTKVSWTDATWNPVIGCRAISPGCQNCFAKRLVNGRMGGDFSKHRRTNPATFNAPLRWNRRPWVCDECGQAFKERWQHYAGPTGAQECLGRSYHRRRVFLGSLMDIFDAETPIEYVADTWDIVRRCPNLIFQCVTKRPELWRAAMGLTIWYAQKVKNNELEQWANAWVEGTAPKNVWVIASVEDQKRADERIPELLKIPAVVHGLSVEPLLSLINLHRVADENGQTFDALSHKPGIALNGVGVDWVIVGGESGPGFRDCGVEAIEDVARQCQAAGVPCYCKQDAGRLPGKQGRISNEVWSLKQFPQL